MTMLETLTKPMRNALDAIRAGQRALAKMNTLEALQTRKLIERVNGVWTLSPAGETIYFEHEVMRKQHGLIFQPGDHVQYLLWKHNTQEWAFEWVEASVTRVTYAFVFLKYADGTEGRRAASSIRLKPDLVVDPIPGVPENADEPHGDIGTLIGEPPLTLPDAAIVAATPLKIAPREYAQYAATHLLTLSGIEVKQIASPDGFDDGVRAIILEAVDQPVFVGTDERVVLATPRERELDAIIIDGDFHLLPSSVPDPYAHFVIGDRAVRKSDNAEIVVESVDGDYISGSGTRYCEKATGLIRSGNGEYIKARDYVYVPVTVKRAHRKHFLKSTNTAPIPEPDFPAAVDAAWKALGISSAQYIAEPSVFDLNDVQLHLNDWVETTEQHQGASIPLYARGQITAFDAAGVRVMFIRFGGSPVFAYYPAESLVKLPPGSEYDFIDTSFEPPNLEPRMVDETMSAVTSVCTTCGCQFDYIWFSDTPNLWKQASMHTLCHVCLWTTCCMCGKDLPSNSHAVICNACESSLPTDTSFEPYTPEPRPVNAEHVAVTAVCDVCGCQYDEIYPISMLQYHPDRPWRWANLFPRCHMCLGNNCFECGAALPATSEKQRDGMFCEVCSAKPAGGSQLGYATQQQPSPNISAAICADYPLLATFLQGGENAIHQLWAWYAGCIATALMDYERMPSDEELYQRAKRSAAALTHLRFEEEYLRLVEQVGHDPLVDVLYHLLPISAETTVRAWVQTWGEFDYTAQLDDERQQARAHAVFVDQMPTKISPDEYRAEQYSEKQGAGVCRVWWHAPSQRRLVEHVTQDDTTGRWYVHARALAIPVPLIPSEYFTVETLTPARVHNHVKRLDDGRTGEIIALGHRYGECLVNIESRSYYWKRIDFDIIYPPDDETTEYESNPAIEQAGEVQSAPLTADEIARNCAAIKLRLSGLRVGRVQSVQHLEGAQYRVEFTHFTHGIPLEIIERIKFVYTIDAAQTNAVLIDITAPTWRKIQSNEAREFQSILDAAQIALKARYNFQHELLVYHPFEDVLVRLLPAVRKLAGVLAVDRGFNNNPCLAQVKLAEIAVA